ncbi:phosphotransferase [Pseudomonadota bacterium]
MELFDQSLLSALQDVELITARPLSGGLSNRCWLLKVRNVTSGQYSSLVWRPIAASSSAFDVSRHHEYRVLAQIAPSGIAPKPAYLLEHGLLVEWIEGEEAGNELSDTVLLKLQADIHTLPVPHWRLDVQQKAAHYWQFIPQHSKTPELISIFHYYQDQQLPTKFADTCCHHDLGRYNIIRVADGRNVVIDWEYAAAGDPSLDLALTINANGLESNGAVEKYCLHRGISNKQPWLDAVADWQPWCDYLAMLWFFVGAEIWQDQGYLESANQLLEKLIFLPR